MNDAQWTQKISLAEGPEREYLQYFYDTMPLSDRLDGDFDTLLAYARHGRYLRENVAWCRALDEETFREYVLYYRVNNEDIRDCRALFFGELWERVRDLTMTQAVLETNRWCHENATYQSTDGRTLSPLGVYRSGSGRCGEESTFLVSALRSVGLPARQIYVPRWSHCDDNHAWVEAFCDGEWHFLGACEPEPSLDRGWFCAASARAMMVHSRSFAGGDSRGEAVGRTGGHTFYNQTPRYAATRRCTFTVLNEDGSPAEGARVRLEVLNGAEFYPIETLRAGAEGTVAVTLGLGDIRVAADLGGRMAQGVCHLDREDGLTLTLSSPELQAHWEPFDFHAPADAMPALPPLTDAQKEERVQTLGRGSGMREERLYGFFDAQRAKRCRGMEDCLRLARGNFEEVFAFLTRDGDPLRARLVRSLSEKDLRDLSGAVLEDHLRAAAPFAGSVPDDVFDRYLLCPRVALEMLTSYRPALAKLLGEERSEAFRTDPPALWSWIAETVRVETETVCENITISPAAALEAGRCDETSRRILFVAACRTLGIPARLSPLDGAPEYWRDGAFRRADPVPMGSVTFEQGRGKMIYAQNWSLARLEDGAWRTFDLSGESWDEGRMRVALPAGAYRVLTTCRMPSGNQLGLERGFPLGEGEEAQIALHLREFKLEDMLIDCAMPPFSARDAEGHKVEGARLLGGGTHLLFWLEAGAEPTEHVLGELIAGRERIERLPASIVFFLRDSEAVQQKTMRRALDAYGSIRVLYGDWDLNLEQLARRLFCDPERPPLAVVCDARGHALYACSGYNVGSVDLISRIVEHMAEHRD